MKGFQKGNKEAAKKGRHEKTKQWETLAESIVTTHTERFNSILETCDDKTFLMHFSSILEYFKPKLARTEITGEDGGAINVAITGMKIE